MVEIVGRRVGDAENGEFLWMLLIRCCRLLGKLWCNPLTVSGERRVRLDGGSDQFAFCFGYLTFGDPVGEQGGVFWWMDLIN